MSAVARTYLGVKDGAVSIDVRGSVSDFDKAEDRVCICNARCAIANKPKGGSPAIVSLPCR